eukprot:CAMPEP_0196663466 /NCGR_PEP_ID=MMETSP1086-20130531/53033_1 /TAXON_ID=77921 /ORGANISM="Cyanoptyche  gloeocystis , Strain SAG4.97" /LENGTH=80 /DNA_ID=CAMNT_0041999299 /DNA_START=466 /DNA_END=707 /DNA_ORIENTATION=-
MVWMFDPSAEACMPPSPGMAMAALLQEVGVAFELGVEGEEDVEGFDHVAVHWYVQYSAHDTGERLQVDVEVGGGESDLLE